METVKLKVPKPLLNQLNNFYLDNFNYDIYTELQNFITNELKRCKECSTDNPPEHPRPTIELAYPFGTSEYLLKVIYPDNSSLEIKHNDYDLLVEMWNAWSKFGFAKESREKVLMKYLPERISNVQRVRGRFIILKEVNGKKYTFANCSNYEDAFTIRNFLIEHNWDLKYQFKRFRDNFEGCNQYNYSDYLLKIAKGELEL